MRLFGFLRPHRALVDHLQALETRVATLEREMHPTRLVEWVEVTEKLKRYLQRLTAVEQRAKLREEGGTTADPVTRAVLSMKYPPKQQGG